MPRKVDLGGYFEQLTKRGRGGRRLDDDAADAADAATDGDPEGDDDDGPPSGSLAERLRDAVGRGRSTARRTAGKVKLPRLPGRRSQEPLPPESVVTIEYSPRQDGDPDPGEVVWTWVPFEEDPSQGKDRPVVIIGRRGRTLVGVPLTTRPNQREAQLNLGTGGWDPKRRTSYARIWRLLDIDADRTRREGAVLDERRFESLVRAIDEYYDIRRPTDSSSDETQADDY